MESSRLQLARSAITKTEDLVRGLESATRIASKTLGVARVGIWLWSDGRTSLECVCLYDAATDSCSSGQSLEAATFPAYCEALLSRRVVAIASARTAPETRELADSYLVPNGIAALLDAPLYRRGVLAGVVCHEHVGDDRVWSDRERDYAASVADLVAVLFEQAAELSLELALAEQSRRAAHADKLEALARFSAGLAHDFNNVLCVIIARADLVRAHLQDAEGIEDLQALVTSAALGTRLVRQLFTYGKTDELRALQVRLDRLVREMRAVLLPLLDGHCELVLDVRDTSATVYADYNQLEQVVMNLVINARDAGARQVRVSVARADEEVVLEVADDGAGIDESTRARIFEPFYTTKPTGQGLGLATVASIIQRHHGRVDVTSEAGRGTTFVVHLPAA